VFTYAVVRSAERWFGNLTTTKRRDSLETASSATEYCSLFAMLTTQC